MYILCALISGVLTPVRVGVQGIHAQRPQTVLRVGVVGIEFCLEAPIVFELTETDQVVTTPVFIQELTATLIQNLLQARFMVKQRSVDICTNLVEQTHRRITVGCRTSTDNSFALHQDNVRIAEDGEVVVLVAAIYIVVIDVREELGTVYIGPSEKCVGDKWKFPK